ncbi:MAG TPA: hypothetical protein VEX38_00810, partial [Fimbriimonadaceae bacterium]|nr:hypothetical protein [Fimbriimonadaceae bacterium]
PDDLLQATIVENARHTIRQLAAESAVLREALASKRIACAAMLYDMPSGEVKLMDDSVIS